MGQELIPSFSLSLSFFLFFLAGLFLVLLYIQSTVLYSSDRFGTAIGNGRENVTEKMHLRSFKPYRVY